MNRKLPDILEALLAEAHRAGSDAADALVTTERSVVAEVRNRTLEHVERSESANVGLRVLVDGRQACVSASDTQPQVLRELAERAVAMAREAPRDPHAGLAEPHQLASEFDLAALELFDASDPPSVDVLIDRSLRAEDAALAVAGVDKVESASAGCGTVSVDLAASNGFSGSYTRSQSGCECAAIAGTGQEMEVDGYGERRVFDSDLATPEETGGRAGTRAAERLGPTRPKTGAFPVIYDERVASSLIGHLLSAINGTAVARGASWMLDALEERVLPRGIDITEQPMRPRSMASRPFDAEGLPQGESAIVLDGKLRRWILDLATGRKLNLDSTGNAFRGLSSPPSPGVTNIEMTLGDLDRSGLAEEMGTGLIVTSLIGMTVNPTTGDYSRGAGGLWVEGGKVRGPVSGFTIAGNLKRMLKTVIPGNDARPFVSRRVPSLLVEGLTIAGD